MGKRGKKRRRRGQEKEEKGKEGGEAGREGGNAVSGKLNMIATLIVTFLPWAAGGVDSCAHFLAIRDGGDVSARSIDKVIDRKG